MNAALIIATGKNASGRSLEPLKEVGSIPAVQRIVRVLQRAGVERIAVVCGEAQSQVEKYAAHMGLEFLHCPEDAELLDGIKTGLAYLLGKCEAALISPVNAPLFSVETVHALLSAEGDVRVPAYHGAPGHPLLLRGERFEAVLSYSGDGGLRGAVEAAGLQCHMVEVEDEGVLANVQSADPYTHLIDAHDLTRLHLDFRVRLMRERVFYGPGAHRLLQLTEETGSLLDACRQMGISYSKGRKIIFSVEQRAGYPILESQQGGKTGGRSVVTEKGKALMAGYAGFCAEAGRYLDELFQKYFPD